MDCASAKWTAPAQIHRIIVPVINIQKRVAFELCNLTFEIKTFENKPLLSRV